MISTRVNSRLDQPPEKPLSQFSLRLAYGRESGGDQAVSSARSVSLAAAQYRDYRKSMAFDVMGGANDA